MELLQLYSEVYDDLFRRADEIITEYNPCDINDGRCAGLCGDFCCKGCVRLGDRGCTIQSVWCKMWLCTSIKHLNPECCEELSRLKKSISPNDSKNTGHIYYCLEGRKAKVDALESVKLLRGKKQQELLKELKIYRRYKR